MQIKALTSSVRILPDFSGESTQVLRQATGKGRRLRRREGAQPDVPLCLPPTVQITEI
jgi:hypothetical protein